MCGGVSEMTPEGAVKRDIRKWLSAHGLMNAGIERIPADNTGWFYMPQNMGMGVSGIPDFVGVIGPAGRFFSIEAKAPGGKPTPVQLCRHAEITAARGIVLVADCVEDLTPLEQYL